MPSTLWESCSKNYEFAFYWLCSKSHAWFELSYILGHLVSSPGCVDAMVIQIFHLLDYIKISKHQSATVLFRKTKTFLNPIWCQLMRTLLFTIQLIWNIWDVWVIMYYFFWYSWSEVCGERWYLFKSCVWKRRLFYWYHNVSVGGGMQIKRKKTHSHSAKSWNKSVIVSVNGPLSRDAFMLGYAGDACCDLCAIFSFW